MKAHHYIVVLALALAISGCAGKKETVVATPGGTVKVTEDGSKTTAVTPQGTVEVQKEGDGATVTQTTKEGTITSKTGASADLSALGVSLYPGATVADSGGAQAEMDTPAGKQLAVVLKSKDSIEKVADHYKKELTEAMSTVMPEGGSVIGKNKDGHQVTVVLSKEDGATSIGISVLKPK
jgi:hypothetical protein